MIKVIAGKYKNHKLYFPSNIKIRPATQKVKEAVFNMLQGSVQNSLVLDLFAGSGSLAIEAISRGAMKAFAVDNSTSSIECILKSVKKLKISNLKIIKSDYLKYLKHSKGKQFDLIFIDPPYKQYDFCNISLSMIEKNDLLKNLGFIIIETNVPKKIILPKSLTYSKIKKYGEIYILIISKNI